MTATHPTTRNKTEGGVWWVVAYLPEGMEIVPYDAAGKTLAADLKKCGFAAATDASGSVMLLMSANSWVAGRG